MTSSFKPLLQTDSITLESELVIDEHTKVLSLIGRNVFLITASMQGLLLVCAQDSVCLLCVQTQTVGLRSAILQCWKWPVRAHSFVLSKHRKKSSEDYGQHILVACSLCIHGSCGILLLPVNKLFIFFLSCNSSFSSPVIAVTSVLV